jgi:hypothetical protein
MDPEQSTKRFRSAGLDFFGESGKKLPKTTVSSPSTADRANE